jgi:hypothetical protein
MGDFVLKADPIIADPTAQAINNANDAFDAAINAINQLQLWQAPDSVIGFDSSRLDNVSDLVIGTPSAPPAAPTRDITIPGIDVNVPNATPIDIDGYFSGIPVPVFDEDNVPTIDIGSIPNPGELTATPPGDAPDLDTTYDKPILEDYTLPAVPTYEDLNIPTVPSIDYYTFDLAAPDGSYVQVPDNKFIFENSDYSSTLVDAVSAELIQRLAGGTGIPVDVEYAIWQRGKDREVKNQGKTEDEILAKNATRGFQRPPGSVMAALDMAAQESQHKIADLSREIMIKQAELEQSNIKHAIETAISLENTLSNSYNQYMNRALDAAKYVQQIAILLYEAQVTKFQVELQAYTAAAEVFKIRTQAELTKAEIYKAEVEGQKLIVDLNNSKVQLYIAQIEGIKQAVDIYKTEWEAVQTQIQAEATKIELYKSQVDAYTAEISGYSAEVGAYAERVRAEAAKADVYDSQVKAFASRIQAYASQVDAGRTIATTYIASDELNIKAALAKIEAIVKETEIQTNVFRAEVDKYRAQAQATATENDGLATIQNAYNQKLNVEASYAVGATNAQIAYYNYLRQATEGSAGLALESLKGSAQIASSLTAAAMSGVNLSSSVSLSNSLSESHSYTEK